VLDGAQGPTIENKILIAQITTDGLFSFSLNIQLGTPDGNVEQYVSSTPIGNEQFFNALNFPLLPVPGAQAIPPVTSIRTQTKTMALVLNQYSIALSVMR